MEEVIGLIIITFGTIFGGILMWKFFDIVRTSIKKTRLALMRINLTD